MGPFIIQLEAAKLNKLSQAIPMLITNLK